MGYFTLLGGLLPESLPNNNKAIYEHLTSKDCVFRNSLDRNYHEECAKKEEMTTNQIKEKCEKDCFVLFTYWMEHEFSPILDTDEVFEWLDKKFPNESREFRADRIFAFLRHYWRYFAVLSTIPVHTLNPSKRLYYLLLDNEVGSVLDLISHTKSWYMGLRGMGKKTFQELCDLMESNRLPFKKEE